MHLSICFVFSIFLSYISFPRYHDIYYYPILMITTSTVSNTHFARAILLELILRIAVLKQILKGNITKALFEREMYQYVCCNGNIL